jgi:hypothetical protein
LPNPEEEIFDQGLAFDLETMLDRRRLLQLVACAGLGAGLLGLVGCGSSSDEAASSGGAAAGSATGSCALIPEETAGPYPADGSNGPDVLSQSGVVRSDIRSSFGEFHFEVYPSLEEATDDANKIATSQIALPEDTCNQVYATGGYSQSLGNMQQVSLESDNVFGDDGGAQQLGTVSGSLDAGYVVELAVAVAT